MDTTQPNSPQEDSEDVVKLLSYLFHEVFVKEENIENKGFVLPVYFFGWLDKNINLLNSEEVCNKLNINTSTWYFVKDLVDSNLGPERVGNLWYSIVLNNRQELVNKLESVSLILLLSYCDGNKFPMQIVVNKDMLTGTDFNDSLVCNIINKHMHNLIELIISKGLDNLHNNSDNYRGNTPEDPFEVCMGLLLLPIKSNTLREDLKKGVETYARLFQAICRPPIPNELKEALEAKRKE